ncbi:MAG: hypothetical protein AAF827_20195 [Cyanobacteria bacterium P01_D01_bin.6]
MLTPPVWPWLPTLTAGSKAVDLTHGSTLWHRKIRLMSLKIFIDIFPDA